MRFPIEKHGRFAPLKLRILAGPALAAVIAGLAAPAAADPASLDLAPFDRMVHGKQFVVFGEDSHGEKPVHELAPVLFKRLVEKQDYRVFVFESAWAIDDGFKDWFASDRTEVDGDESFFLNAFNSQPIVDMLVWIRAWNRARPSDQIHIAGYQPEQPVTDIAALRAYVDAHAPKQRASLNAALAPCKAGDAQYTSNIGWIGAMGNRRRKEKLPAMTPEERGQCLTGIAKAEAMAKADGADAQEARLHALSLKTYVDVLLRGQDEGVVATAKSTPEQASAENARLYSEGDRVRFIIWEGLRKTRYGANAKAFLWMHNWHAANRTKEMPMVVEGLKSYPLSLGTRLHGQYGARMVTVGNIIPCTTECTEPDRSLEPAFAARFGGKTTVVDFADPAAVADLPVASPHTMYANFHKFGFDDVVLNRQFDGVIYMPKGAMLH
jgi:erythromycin esterase-like protein